MTKHETPVKYFSILVKDFYEVFVRYDTGREKFMFRVQSKTTAEELVKEFNNDIKN